VTIPFSEKYLKHRYWFTVIRVGLIVLTIMIVRWLFAIVNPTPRTNRSDIEAALILVMGICVGAALQVRAISDKTFIQTYGFNLRKWFLMAFSKGHSDYFSVVSGWATGVLLIAWLNHDWSHLVGIPGYAGMILAARVGADGPMTAKPKAL
jgi:hypothetical protein